ncbi:hypothetical protein A0H81_06704 [Grifola frondosa]|uniref:Uncharacterized protein n=1 Tax=Grifola frondosa TaxID=5627 RepID=A0A1C7M7S7_GRIFR|nr:hypothetical protein A0H81_06704 [Grifola frondosa]
MGMNVTRLRSISGAAAFSSPIAASLHRLNDRCLSSAVQGILLTHPGIELTISLISCLMFFATVQFLR